MELDRIYMETNKKKYSIPQQIAFPHKIYCLDVFFLVSCVVVVVAHHKIYMCKV